MSAALKKAVGAFGDAAASIIMSGALLKSFVKNLDETAITKAKASVKTETKFDFNKLTNDFKVKAPKTTKGVKGADEMAGEMAKEAKKAVADPNNIPERAVADTNNIGRNMPDTKGGKWTAALKLMTTVAVMLGGTIIAVLVVDSYANKAAEEKAVCLADWTAAYIDVLTRSDGTLYKIDTPEEWTASILEIQSYINALDSVKNDEAKATKFLLDMNEGLMKCLAIDTEPISATISGLAKSAGDAVKKVLTGVTDPINDSLSSLATVGIVIGCVIGAIVLLMIVYYVVSTKPTRQRHKDQFLRKYGTARDKFTSLQRRLREGASSRLQRRRYPRLLE